MELVEGVHLGIQGATIPGSEPTRESTRSLALEEDTQQAVGHLPGQSLHPGSACTG